jgi:hypothetical protein
MSYHLWTIRLRWWRLLAWFFGTIASTIERFHEGWHPERVIAYRCDMCEVREGGWWESKYNR